MLEILPKLPEGSVLDIKKIKASMKSILNIEEEEDSLILFLIPVNIEQNNVVIDQNGLFIHNPICEKTEYLFSENKANFFNMMESYLRISTNKNNKDRYKDFLLGYGSIDGEIVIDGYIKDVSKLENNGMSIVDAYFTLKKDDLYYSESAIRLDVIDLIEQVVEFGLFNPSEHFDGLQRFFESLISFVKNGLHKKDGEFVTKVIRDSFYKELNVKEIEEEKGSDLFLTFVEALNVANILNASGRMVETGEVFDYFEKLASDLDNELGDFENIYDDEIVITIYFNERFIRVFCNKNKTP